MNRFIKMHEDDMVATALVDLSKGQTAHVFATNNVLISEIVALDDIPYGNKIALGYIKAGDRVIKYGSVIGQCTKDISHGALVHVHNVKSLVVDIPPAFKVEILRQMGIDEKVGEIDEI